MAPNEAVLAKMRPPPAGVPLMIVLQPVSHPELEPIHVDETLFAIGRTESPFDRYPPEIAAELSRRHARIFREHGAVYLADLGSKNGTTVNGADVRQAITRLNDGDLLGLGRSLSYRVELEAAALVSGPAARLAGLTLTPEHGEAGLQPIVLTQFPFLISKTDEAFARYRDTSPQQLNYLSRRHAHIFLKGGKPFIEELGSTNGSFVGGHRLDEHAVELHDGEVLAFGGHHFVYRLSLQWEQAALDPTVTRLGVVPPGGSPSAADPDKTTFVAAADSFLDIFCLDQADVQDDEVNDAGASGAGATQAAEAARPRAKVAAFLSDLMASLSGSGSSGMRRAVRWGMGALAAVAILGWVLYRAGAPERDARDLLASGAYARAAAVASAGLARDPDNAALRTVGTVALLKANIPAWAAALKANQYERAAAIVAGMKQRGHNNPELLPLVGELEWIVNLERFVSARGGADAPARDTADAARIKLILKQWEDESQAHQRAFSTISSYAPAYRDAYAEALSHVRKLALSGGRLENEAKPP